MAVIRKLLETLDNISLDDIDVPLVILLSVIIIILAFKFGKKDDGKPFLQEVKNTEESMMTKMIMKGSSNLSQLLFLWDGTIGQGRLILIK